MDLRTHYDNLYKNSLQVFSSQGVEVDHNIDNPKDDRYGLTLIFRPDENTRKKMIEFTNELSKIDSLQYYYPSSDIHITILSIISCTAGLKLKNIEVSDYINLIAHQLKGIGRFELNMEGITASPSCIMIRGYPKYDTLNSIRNRLRSAFKLSDLEQSLDQRYLLQTAHSTVMRFRQPLKQKNLILETIEKFKIQSFGTFEVRKVDLVYNDWYHKRKNVQLLHSFDLAR